MLAIPEPDGRFLHNHSTHPEYDCRELFGLTPATQRYKGRLCGIKAQEVAVLCRGDLYTTIIIALAILTRRGITLQLLDGP